MLRSAWSLILLPLVMMRPHLVEPFKRVCVPLVSHNTHLLNLWRWGGARFRSAKVLLIATLLRSAKITFEWKEQLALLEKRAGMMKATSSFIGNGLENSRVNIGMLLRWRLSCLTPRP